MQRKITIFSLNLNYGGIEKYLSILSNMLDNDFDIEIITTFKFDTTPSFPFSDKIKIKYLVNENPTDISIKKLLKEKKKF